MWRDPVQAQWPVAGVVYTDIERDGMMSGLNIEATHALALASNLLYRPERSVFRC